jgi:hypothetical protein
MPLIFKEAKSTKDIQNIYEYNIDAFSDSPDFKWSLDDIKNEIKNGWSLYAAFLEEEVIAAIFLKKTKDGLLSKNTAIKMAHQGAGLSHKVKDFVEVKARELKSKRVLNYCGIDNFRMYSLNERHGYHKTGRIIGDKGQVVEWVKEIE